MSWIARHKLLLGVIVTLLLINTGILTFLWVNRVGMPLRHNPDTVFNYVRKELKLTPEQTEKYSALRDAHHSKMVQLQEKSKKLHDNFFDLIHGNEVDSLKENQLADSLAAVQKEIDLTTLNHFKQVRTICTPEQQQRFDQIINEAMHMMGGPRPPREERR